MEVFGFPGEKEKCYDLYKSSYILEKPDDGKEILTKNKELGKIFACILKMTFDRKGSYLLPFPKLGEAMQYPPPSSWREATELGLEVIAPCIYFWKYKCFPEGEKLTKQIINLTMIGNQGILTYINQTSRGQSGGAVVQIFEDYTQLEERKLVGIHVSGHLKQSKCTLLLKSNLDWINSIIGNKNSEKNLYESLPFQDRILNFLDRFETYKEEEICIEDLEIFPITSKLMSLLENTKIKKMKINLHLDRISRNHEEKLKQIFQGLVFVFEKESDLNTLNLEYNDKFDEISMNLLSTFLPKCSYLKNLNFSYCYLNVSICNIILNCLQEMEFLISLNLTWNEYNQIDVLCEQLPKTNIENLNLNSTNINDKEFQKLLQILPKTKIKKLNLSENKFRTFPENIENLIQTEIEELDISANGKVAQIEMEEWKKIVPILPQTKLTLFKIEDQVIPYDIKNKLEEVCKENNIKIQIYGKY